MPLNQYRVVHQNHADVALGEVFPENLEFAIYLSDIGYCTYDIDLSNPMAKRTMTEAYVTDYVLYVDNTPLQGGMHTDINIEDVTQNVLAVSGKEWKHYLERRQWDFDPSNPVANLYSAFQQDLFDIVRDLLNEMMSDPNSLVITYDDPGALSGELQNYRIDAGDTDFLYNKIAGDLASLTPGFDFEITWDRVLRMYAPKKGSVNNEVVFELGKNIQQFGYAERGIDATRLLGLGSGTTSQLGSLQEDTDASVKYRRHDNSVDFGSVNSSDLLTGLTKAELEREDTPITTFSCVYIPDANFDFWNSVKVGDICEVRGDVGYDKIDDRYRLTAILSQPTNKGDDQISLTFDDATISL